MRARVLPPGARLEESAFESLLERTLLLPPSPVPQVDTSRYVAVDGIDGVGKTTISRTVVGLLRERGCEAEYVSEPFTDEVRALLSRYPDVNPVVEAMLFAADRLLLHAEVLPRILEKGRVVVSDRCFVASLVYQVLRGAPEPLVMSLNYFALRPSLVVLLDAPPPVVLARLTARGHGLLRHLEKPDYLEALRRRYVEVLENLGLTYVVLDASAPLEEVAMKALDVISSHIGCPGASRARSYPSRP